MKLEILSISIISVGLRGINMRRKNENDVINFKKNQNKQTRNEWTEHKYVRVK